MASGPVAAVVMQLSLKYVKASLLYLTTGATLLFLMFSRVLAFELTAFYFMQLYGFVAMMIFGLSYLFIPAFAHGFLHSLRLAKIQFWLMNAATVVLTVAFSGLIPYGSDVRYVTIATFAMLLAAVYIHGYNLWRTMRAWRGSPGEKLASQAEGRI